MNTKRRSGPARREKILEVAGPFLKRHGVDGAPVDEIMSQAGLTSGALYSHFRNKEDLCTQAICQALDGMLDRYRTAVRGRGRDGLELLVSEYLSHAHAANVSAGCPLAALGADLARAGSRSRRLYELRIQALIGIFMEGLGNGSMAARRATAEHLLATMLGALTLARAMSNADAAGRFLSQVRSRVLRDLEQEREH